MRENARSWTVSGTPARPREEHFVPVELPPKAKRCVGCASEPAKQWMSVE